MTSDTVVQALQPRSSTILNPENALFSSRGGKKGGRGGEIAYACKRLCAKKASIVISLGKKGSLTNFPRFGKDVCPSGGLLLLVVSF